MPLERPTAAVGVYPRATYSTEIEVDCIIQCTLREWKNLLRNDHLVHFQFGPCPIIDSHGLPHVGHPLQARHQICRRIDGRVLAHLTTHESSCFTIGGGEEQPFRCLRRDVCIDQEVDELHRQFFLL